jgi:hypothetical protein
MLRLVKEIQSPQQQKQINEEVNMEQKLILDQPDTVTEKGKVEHVIPTPEKQINEQKGEKKEKKPDILLNEGPVEGGFVIVGE